MVKYVLGVVFINFTIRRTDMKVKITGHNLSDNVWYANLVGQIFEVEYTSESTKVTKLIGGHGLYIALCDSEIVDNEQHSRFEELFGGLRKDKELYDLYKAAIAMAYYDEALRQKSRDSHKTIHNIANVAAGNFLKLSIKKMYN